MSARITPITAAKGTLYLVPAPLDFGCTDLAPLTDVMPLATLQVAARLTHWICENAKSTRAYLKRVDVLQPLAQPVQSLQIQELPRDVHKKGDHLIQVNPFDARPLLAAALAGEDMGLVSEAGMPAIADPGASVVRAAHTLGIGVMPLVGPSSLLLSLAVSGMNGQSFAFVGYLPQDAAQRMARIRELDSLCQKTGQTQILIETPYRNAAVLQALLTTLQPRTRLSASFGMTLPTMVSRSDAVAQWKAKPGHQLPLGLPAVFSIGV